MGELEQCQLCTLRWAHHTRGAFTAALNTFAASQTRQPVWQNCGVTRESV